MTHNTHGPTHHLACHRQCGFEPHVGPKISIQHPIYIWGYYKSAIDGGLKEDIIAILNFTRVPRPTTCPIATAHRIADDRGAENVVVHGPFAPSPGSATASVELL